MVTPFLYVWLYNHNLPQKALNRETPIQALKRWQSTHPELFAKKVQDRPEPDSHLFLKTVLGENQLLE